MITTEQLKKGLFHYFEKEIFPSVGGLLTEKGIMKNNMVDINRLCSELKKVLPQTVHFPIIGDILFTVDDIEKLKDYVIDNK